MQMRHRFLQDHDYHLVSIGKRRDWATDLAIEIMQVTDSMLDLSDATYSQRVGHVLRDMEILILLWI